VVPKGAENGCAGESGLTVAEGFERHDTEIAKWHNCVKRQVLRPVS
jgi:hypothetical protein